MTNTLLPSRSRTLAAGLGAAAFTLALSLSATAQEPAPAPPAPSAIAEQAGLAPSDHGRFDALYIRPGTELSRFQQVLIAPVAVAIERGRDELILDERTVRHAREEFVEELTKALGAGNIAQAPGPGVVRLDVTVTDYTPNNPADPRKRLGGIISESIGIGDAAFQAVLTDSVSGEVVAVLADADRGLPFQTNPRLFMEFGDADRFVKRWSKEIAELLGMDRGS